jgi:hypothetical protein
MPDVLRGLGLRGCGCGPYWKPCKQRGCCSYFGRRNQDTDEIGFIDAKTQAIFGRTYAAEPDVLIQQLKEDEAIAAADTLLLTVPNQLGVDYNAHVIDSILTHVAPALGWR